MELLLFPVIIFFIAIAALSVLLHFVPIGLWISALAADVNISLFNLVGMRIRRVSPQMIVLPLIKGTKAGLLLSVNQLEAHYLAGGNVDNVVDALIAAHRAQIDLSFEQGNTVVVIEHNLDVVKTADYIIDLGPEGGDKGGEIVATGTPEEVAKVEASYTGQYLGPVIERTKKFMGLK